MSPSDYEYLFILDALERREPIFPFILTALKDSGLVEITDSGVCLTTAGELLMRELSQRETTARQFG